MPKNDDFDPLETFVHQHLPPPRGNDLLRANRLLHSLRYSEHTSIVERIISYGHDADTPQTVDRIEDAFRRILEEFIQPHQILIEHYDISVLGDIIEALYGFSDFEELEALEQAIEEQADAQEALVEVVAAYHSNERQDEYRAAVSYVHPELIESMRVVIEQKRAMEPQQTKDEEMISRERRLRQFLNTHTTPAMTQLIDEQDYPLDLDFERYMNEIIDFEYQGMRDKQAEQMAADILAAILSCGKRDLESVNATLESYFEDMQFLQQVVHHMHKLRGAAGL